MAETKFNPNAIRKLGEEIKRKYVHDWQAIHDAVWRTHAGSPRSRLVTGMKGGGCRLRPRIGCWWSPAS